MTLTESEIIVGIDLGTTNSAIAVMEGKLPKLIQIDGRSTMPSCVGLGESGEILVGQPALNQMLVAPERTITSVKRKMGSELPVKLGGKKYQPEEISAFILNRLKTEAERELGRPVKKAVITVPAYFDEKQRRATQNAAELAGLNAVRILNEPTAAALAYNLQSSEKQTILVYDLGGGTFDVSIVKCEEGLVEVCASHGDTQLGGDDFDQVLVEALVEGWSGSESLDVKAPQTSRRLMLAAESAKCSLSDKPFEEISEDYLAGNDHLQMELSRNDFEQRIGSMLAKTLDSIHEALSTGGLSVHEIDKVLLVGGSTRIPLVQSMIEQRMGQPASREVDPDLIVTMGAAIQGGIIAGMDVGSILVDISSQTFSNLTLDPSTDQLTCVPVISRGTPLPVTRSEAFYTTMDNQQEIMVAVFQGESSHPEDNLEIGKFEVEGLGEVPAGNIILIEFSLDLNGILKVTAKEKSTGFEKMATIDTRDVETSFDLEKARKRMSDIFVNENDTAAEEVGGSQNSELTRAKGLKKRAEKILEKDKEMDSGDSSEINSLLSESLAAVKSRNYEELSALSDKLEDIIFYLEV
jgi:molecular chaperone DnaK